VLFLLVSSFGTKAFSNIPLYPYYYTVVLNFPENSFADKYSKDKKIDIANLGMRALINTVYLRYASVPLGNAPNKVDIDFWEIYKNKPLDLIIIPDIKKKKQIIKFTLSAYYKFSDKYITKISYYIDDDIFTEQIITKLFFDFFAALYNKPNFIPEKWKIKPPIKNNIVLDLITYKSDIKNDKENNKEIVFYWGRTIGTLGYIFYINGIQEYKGNATNFALNNPDRYGRIDAYVQTISDCTCKPNLNSLHQNIPNLYSQKADFVNPLPYNYFKHSGKNEDYIYWATTKYNKNTIYNVQLDDKLIYNGKDLKCKLPDNLENGKHTLKLQIIENDNVIWENLKLEFSYLKG